MAHRHIATALREIIHTGRVPGIVVAVAQGGAAPVLLAEGHDAAGAPLDADTLFPVASITKLAAALAVLRLCDQGLLALDDPIGQHLPAAAAAQPGVTIRRLLCHTAGLPTDVPPRLAAYAEGLDWPALAEACLLTPPDFAPATRVHYSNVGYGLLALAVERHTEQSFAAALQALVLGPLGIVGYLGHEPPRPPAQIANVRSTHAGGPLEPFNSRFWRSLALPWAGLVTNAAGALALAQAFRRPGFLSPALAAAATRDQTGGLNGGFIEPLYWEPCPWGLGPELHGAKQPHWVGAAAGADSFGHSGASGCLAWHMPVADTAFALLGARTADSGWLLRRAPLVAEAILGDA